VDRTRGSPARWISGEGAGETYFPTQWATFGFASAAGDERGGRNAHAMATALMTIRWSR
jgi:hypothetical protein